MPRRYTSRPTHARADGRTDRRHNAYGAAHRIRAETKNTRKKELIWVRGSEIKSKLVPGVLSIVNGVVARTQLVKYQYQYQY